MLGLARVFSAASRLWRDTRGNFAMMTGIVMPVLLVGTGFGVNIGQVTLTRANLLAALDAAVTSTARDLTTGAIQEKDARPLVEAFLIANGLRAYAEDGRLKLDSLTIDRQARTVSAQASVLLDVAFPFFASQNQQLITTRSAALYSDKRVEVAMMLDVTGSMSGSKIRDLKAAATNAIDALIGAQNPQNPRVRIALIPYSDGVNVGSALANETVFVEREGRWDLPPPIGASQAQITANTGARTNNCATERRTENLGVDYSDDGPDARRTWYYDKSKKYYAKVNRDDRLKTCVRAVLRPLTADAALLKQQIQGFSIDGYTGGAIGIQWTYYMLSPNWRAAIRRADLGDGPEDHDPREVAKIAILMTDGDFNTAHADAVGDVQNQKSKSRANAEALCRRMKDDGIEIFTIGFGLGNNQNARRIMQNCASSDTNALKHYFETSTGSELNEAFMTIARNIEALALTQ